MERSAANPASFRFGSFEADLRIRELRKHGVRVQVRDKSFELLLALLEHAGEVVMREDLQRRLWPGGVFVEFDASLNSTMNRLRDVLGDTQGKPRYIQTLPRRGYRFIARVTHMPAGPPSLAVLPFQNLNGDPDQDLFADGVADALTTALGNISTLRVISRQSVLHLKGSDRTLPEIARELKIDTVVEGSVLQAGNRVRITAQLVQAAPERHLWARSYDCELGDILTVQGQVSLAIAEAVEVALTPDEERRLSRPRSVDPAAHLDYLKGRHHMGKWSREGFEKALGCFQSAVAKDPTHSPAYAHMADCYGMLGHWGHRPFIEAFRAAKKAALESLALDDSLSTAHWAYAWATWICDRDLATCESEMRRAIALNPSDEHAHAAYSVFLSTAATERTRALAEMRIALDLDPLSSKSNTLMAWAYLWARDYGRAASQARRTMELFPTSLAAWWVLGLAESGRSRHDEAIAALEKAAAISREPLSIAYLGTAHARAGHIATAVSLISELLSRSSREPVPPRCFVFLYAAIGEQERALEWLQRAYEAHDSGLLWLRAMPLYEPLRRTPEVRLLRRRMGLRE